jgi:septum formation topological specificity factor MinE
MQPAGTKRCLIITANRTLFFMEEVLPELKTFILTYCNKYKIVQVDEGELTLETSVDLDLDIFDIEIDLFLSEFAETFSLDRSKFSWYKYGYPKGSARVGMVKAIFGYRSRWVKRLAHRIYKPRFRVYHMQQALKCGKLV